MDSTIFSKFEVPPIVPTYTFSSPIPEPNISIQNLDMHSYEAESHTLHINKITRLSNNKIIVKKTFLTIHPL